MSDATLAVLVKELREYFELYKQHWPRNVPARLNLSLTVTPWPERVKGNGQ